VTKSSTQAVRTRQLTAGYGGTPAIQELDLDVSPGEIAVLLGANGSGKTTTLLALAGELRPMSGTADVLECSRRSRLDRRARSGLGFLTEGRCVFMDLTGWENLKLGRGKPRKAVDHFPELQPHLNKKAGLLSGGQQQMLALGRILASEPRLILADELSLGLAPLVVQRLLEALRAAADRGTAVVLVEQHIRHALTVADKGYVLRRGRVALSGTGSELAADAEAIGRHYIAGET
jgi:branched-chain amino acid transport system ATP-binding protein